MFGPLEICFQHISTYFFQFVLFNVHVMNKIMFLDFLVLAQTDDDDDDDDD